MTGSIAAPVGIACPPSSRTNRSVVANRPVSLCPFCGAPGSYPCGASKAIWIFVRSWTVLASLTFNPPAACEVR